MLISIIDIVIMKMKTVTRIVTDIVVIVINPPIGPTSPKQENKPETSIRREKKRLPLHDSSRHMSVTTPPPPPNAPNPESKRTPRKTENNTYIYIYIYIYITRQKAGKLRRAGLPEPLWYYGTLKGTLLGHGERPLGGAEPDLGALTLSR